jgi:superfamily II DNA/RNA helicase
LKKLGVVQIPGRCMVFTRTKHRADWVSDQLVKKAGIQALVIHGGRSQNQREGALLKFKVNHAQQQPTPTNAII